MEFIREATVEVVRDEDLSPGDKILYSNMELTIKSVGAFTLPVVYGGGRGRPILAYQFDDPETEITVGPFRRYYRIINAIKIDGCVSCEKELDANDDPHHSGGMCDRCYVESIMGSYEDPKTGERWTDDYIQIAEEEQASQYQ